jgi:hypothetical protein
MLHVITGLVPLMTPPECAGFSNRDGRHKAGHDGAASTKISTIRLSP